MDSSRRRKCVFTDRPFIWRQKHCTLINDTNYAFVTSGRSSMIFISDVITFYRRYFRYVVTQTITLSRCHVWHHAYLPMQWASCCLQQSSAFSLRREGGTSLSTRLTSFAWVKASFKILAILY